MTKRPNQVLPRTAPGVAALASITALFLGLGLVLVLAGCARYAHGSARVALGMTQVEVRRACGAPYSRTPGISVEHWFYHDAAWDDSVSTEDPPKKYTDIVFVGGRVASFGPVAQAPQP